jgi:hypothetical protein
MAVLLAGLVHPVVVQVREQIPAAHGHGLRELPAGDQLLEVGEVDRDLRAGLDPDPLARRSHHIRRRITELALERRERGPQAGSRALLEDIRPEHPGNTAAGMQPGMDREPAEQGACPLACDPIRLALAHLERKITEHADAHLLLLRAELCQPHRLP